MWLSRTPTFFLLSLWLLAYPTLQEIPLCKQGEIPMLSVLNPSAKVHFYFVTVLGLHDLGPSPDTCGAVRSSGLQLTEAFLWYLKKFGLSNNDISSGGIVFDSCSDQQLIIQKVLSFETSQTSCAFRDGTTVKPSNVFIYIGADNLQDTIALSQALDRTNKTLISSFLDTDPLVAYPYFLQSTPENNGVDNVLIDLLKSNNVNHFLLVHENNKNWLDRSQKFSQSAKTLDICTVHSSSLPGVKSDASAFDKIVSDLIPKKSATYVIVMAEKPATSQFIKAISRNPEARESFVLITFGFFEYDPPAGIKYLALIPSLPSMPATDQFLSDYKKMLTDKTKSPWVEEYCKKMPCTNPNIELDPRVPFLFLTLNASMTAVKDCRSSLCTSDKKSWPQDVLKFTKNVQLSIGGVKQNVFTQKGVINPSITKFQLKISNHASLVSFFLFSLFLFCFYFFRFFFFFHVFNVISFNFPVFHFLSFFTSLHFNSFFLSFFSTTVLSFFLSFFLSFLR